MKKRKISQENRQFLPIWESLYFFTMQNSKLTCLICRDTISVLKEYNVRRHHESKHKDFKFLSKEQRTIKLNNYKTGLHEQQSTLRAAITNPLATIRSSYHIASIIAKRMKPFSDGEFAKECIETVVNEITPDNNRLFSKICLSRQTISRRIKDISDK